MTETAAATVDEQPFSAALRAATTSGHSAAEGAEFMGALGPGTFSLADYAALAKAHLTIYRALEEAAAQQEPGSVSARFLHPGLNRVARLEADLALLADMAPEQPVVPSARDYAARITEVASLPGRFVAHHYTRYMGDLSGGQMIRHRLLQLHPQVQPATTFYDFPDLGPLGAFKKQYRALLDGIEPRYHAEMIEETQLAYDLNVKVFVELHQLRAA